MENSTSKTDQSEKVYVLTESELIDLCVKVYFKITSVTIDLQHIYDLDDALSELYDRNKDLIR